MLRVMSRAGQKVGQDVIQNEMGLGKLHNS